jgi:hypothetical protein
MVETRIYKVRLYNPATDETFISRRMATIQGAAFMRGEIIEGTGFVMDQTELEAGEKWTPRDFDPAASGYKKARD